MTWHLTASPHIGCRTVLKSVKELRCVDHAVTLVLPLRAEDAPTSTPPPFEPLTGRDDLKPMPSYVRTRVLAEIAARKHARTTHGDEKEQG